MYATKFLTASLVVFTISASLPSCQTNQDNPGSKTLESDANADNTMLRQAQKEELHAEYAKFKADADLTIAANNKKIAAIKVKLAKSEGDAPLDGMRSDRIESLEKQNEAVRLRLTQYEDNPTDWEKFKSEFNHDMKSIQDAFRELGEDNVVE